MVGFEEPQHHQPLAGRGRDRRGSSPHDGGGDRRRTHLEPGRHAARVHIEARRGRERGALRDAPRRRGARARARAAARGLGPPLDAGRPRDRRRHARDSGTGREARAGRPRGDAEGAQAPEGFQGQRQGLGVAGLPLLGRLDHRQPRQPPGARRRVDAGDPRSHARLRLPLHGEWRVHLRRVPRRPDGRVDDQQHAPAVRRAAQPRRLPLADRRLGSAPQHHAGEHGRRQRAALLARWPLTRVQAARHPLLQRRVPEALAPRPRLRPQLGPDGGD